MAKRSPILGYNHNVRYRGLVFHVQTEDSGVLNPHLFTHLFHEGVIVSTRKLVYDAGSNEEAIKSLMQAQHKAVMKDLRKGTFDDKIDQYLGGTPGLVPRGAARAERPLAAADASPRRRPSTPSRAGCRSRSPPRPPVEPIELPTKVAVRSTRARRPRERISPPAPPPPDAACGDAPTLEAAADDGAAVAAATPVRSAHGDGPRDAGAADVAAVAPPTAHAQPPTPFASTPTPVIEISVDDDHDGRARDPRDTAGRDADATAIAAAHRRRLDAADAAGRARPPATVRATLPAMQAAVAAAIAPPLSRARSARRKSPTRATWSRSTRRAAVGRAAAGRARRASRSVLGQPQGRRAPIREQTGRIAAIARPGRDARRPRSARRLGRDPRRATRSREFRRRPDAAARRRIATDGTAQRGRPRRRPGARVPQPQQPPGRVHATAPIANRTPSPSQPADRQRRRDDAAGGDRRCATEAAAAATPRVRKAREDEGRGFGQGLISEKSLDEVILAYLSEDAEDK